LIAAHGHDDGAGALGIAPKANILPIRIGTGQIGAHVGEGVDWAIDHGARVICLALRATLDQSLMSALSRAKSQDVVVVAGVGNQPEDPAVSGPAKYPGVIAAAGVGRNGLHA